jgi:hypothetical protein
LSLTDYPAIAACAGAWSVGGVTRDDMAPTCNRQAGNDSSNKDGAGCSAVDNCAVGWHICKGQLEVAQKAPLKGCDDAVPAGAAPKSLFFAIHQNSTLNSTCDNSTNGNDVFGCGNLGTDLSPERNCGPLTKVLASMQSGTCGFNEAEPLLGPFVRVGADVSERTDLKEGTLVKKNGCPGNSCAYDGHPVGSSDKGGVLCCRD